MSTHALVTNASAVSASAAALTYDANTLRTNNKRPSLSAYTRARAHTHKHTSSHLCDKPLRTSQRCTYRRPHLARSELSNKTSTQNLLDHVAQLFLLLLGCILIHSHACTHTRTRACTYVRVASLRAERPIFSRTKQTTSVRHEKNLF